MRWGQIGLDGCVFIARTSPIPSAVDRLFQNITDRSAGFARIESGLERQRWQ